jgi:hypothetical protein
LDRIQTLAGNLNVWQSLVMRSWTTAHS